MMKTITSLKKLFSLALLLVLGNTAANAASGLYFKDINIAAGEEQEIQLLFDTDAEDIKNIDATIALPEGLSFVDYGSNTFAQLNDDRLNGMVSFNYATGSLKIKGIGDVIVKGEGAIATFKVKAGDELATSSKIAVKDIVLTHNDNTSENLEATEATVTCEGGVEPQPDLAITFDPETVELAAGDEAVVNVNMTTTQSLTMFSATLVLPEGITAQVAQGTKGKPSYNAGTGNIVFTSLKSAEGALLVITLKAGEDFAAAGEVKLTNIVGSTKSATRFPAEDAILSVTVKQPVEPLVRESVAYSWSTEQVDETVTINEVGGKAEASDGESVGYLNATFTTIRLNGKKDFSTSFVTITLDNELKAGDKISITAYRNKDAAEKKSGALLKFEKGSTTVSTATNGGLEFININENVKDTEEYGTEPNTVVLEVPEDAAGSKVITMTRAETATNIFITKIEIVTKEEVSIDELKKELEAEIAKGEEILKSEVGTEEQAAALQTAVEDGKEALESIQPKEVQNAIDVLKAAIEAFNTATGISTVAVESKTEGIYTLAGQRVKAATKGLYIINGKKVVIK